MPTANSQQPTANSQQPTANSQQPTANSQQPTANSHENRLYCGDCKAVFQELINQGIEVDLIYLDPPFNSNRVYNLTYKSKSSKKTAQQVAFHDMWTPTKQTQYMFDEFKTFLADQRDIDQSVKAFLEAWLSALNEGNTSDRKLLNYLLYMTERLILMKKVLKNTGSIYYHCDPTASHYIKVVMDGVFGRGNFQNEFIWYYSGGGASNKRWARKHDVILFYTKSNKKWFFNADSVRVAYKWDKGQRRADGSKRDYSKGKLADDVWENHSLMPWSKERIGYPTQKPVALLDRIFKASCPENGIVLDPFCGCGTAVDSAIMNGKRWIGIDISSFSIDIIKDRIKARGVEEGRDFTVEYIRPKSWEEYDRLNAYDKQDFLIETIGGMPNRRKSGDGGVDGELTIHKGIDKNGEDIWGKVVFSVKTGKQKNPAMLRELKGLLKPRGEFDIGVLLLDADPSPNMVAEAEASKKLKYQIKADLEPTEFDTLQIYTATQVLEGVQLAAPKSMLKVKEYRKLQKELFS